ncbi:uncharacterized protein LOC142655499 [Rhinoderma darwinii]|uniref:uncharacterized protein LOC142655499 n=1 Tax=Rhinoderma darwinii TaxID=43563 RepID=UPI003F672072
MAVNHLFEELYQSLTQKKENLSKQSSKRSLQNVTKHEISYSPGRYQTFKKNNVASRNIMSETFAKSSQHSAMGTYSLEGETILIKSTKLTTTVCKGEDILSMEEESHQESSCEFSGSDCIALIAETLGCQSDCESECFNSQYNYEVTDGYQSGESKMNDVLRLCKDCKNLYKKVRKRKPPAVIGDPRTTDLNSWYSKSWIFVNRISARGSRRTLKRGLGSVLKSLRSMQISRCYPTSRTYWTCCRSHVFLKRNLRLCKVEQKRLLFESQDKKKRKQPNSGRKSRSSEKSIPSNQANEIVLQTGNKTHKNYSFVLDSSQEESTSLEIKRYKLEIKHTGRKPLLRQTETPNNSISGGLVHSHLPCFDCMTQPDQEGRVVNDLPLEMEPFGHDTRPPIVCSVQSESFREQFVRLNMGYSKGAIINES